MKPIVCDGVYLNDSETYDVNLSSIFSYLIRECGRLVEDYNADILCDFKLIVKFVTEPVFKTIDSEKNFWIGFRESGVDHEGFIECRIGNDYYYRGLYKINVKKTDKKCVVTLTKETPYDFRKEHPDLQI